MNRLLKLLGYRDRDYRAKDFNVRIEPISREELRVIYESGQTWNFAGTYIGNVSQGRKWEGIGVVLSQEISSSQANVIANRLTKALKAMGYGYVIYHTIEVVPTSIGPNSQHHRTLAKSEGF